MQQQKVWKGLQACVRKMAHAPFSLEITGSKTFIYQMLQSVANILTFTGNEKFCDQNHLSIFSMGVVAKGSCEADTSLCKDWPTVAQSAVVQAQGAH